jgi:pyruvate dehydrogenase E1 component alpha subunit
MIGGFFHSYIGQEAVATAVVDALGPDNWFAASYRCHAQALLLGATPNELMAELYGRANGNAKGRGGSMHFYTERLLGGFGIVGGQVPIATGAAFTLKYLQKKEELSLCFLGDGAVAQGAVHESLNLAALWNLPCIYVIENNQWGMGTHVRRALAVSEKIAAQLAPAYGLKGYTVDGMDYLSCYTAFEKIGRDLKENGRPVLIETVTERFKGHSVSDPGLYRSKEELSARMERDPIALFNRDLQLAGYIDESAFRALDKEQKERIIAAMKYAEESPWPDPATLEEDVVKCS